MGEGNSNIVKISCSAGNADGNVVYCGRIRVKSLLADYFAVYLICNRAVNRVRLYAQTLPNVVCVVAQLCSVGGEHAVIIYNKLCYRGIAAVERNVTGVGVLGEKHVCFKNNASGNGIK